MHPRSRGSGAGRLAARQAGGWLGPAPCRTSTPGGRSEYGRWGGAGRPLGCGAAGGGRPRPRVGLARARRLAWPRAPLASGAPRLPAAASRVQHPGTRRISQGPAPHTRRPGGGGPQQPVNAGMGVGRPTRHRCAWRCARLCARAVCAVCSCGLSSVCACSGPCLLHVPVLCVLGLCAFVLVVWCACIAFVYLVRPSPVNVTVLCVLGLCARPCCVCSGCARSHDAM